MLPNRMPPSYQITQLEPSYFHVPNFSESIPLVVDITTSGGQVPIDATPVNHRNERLVVYLLLSVFTYYISHFTYCRILFVTPEFPQSSLACCCRLMIATLFPFAHPETVTSDVPPRSVRSGGLGIPFTNKSNALKLVNESPHYARSFWSRTDITLYLCSVRQASCRGPAFAMWC